MYVIHVENTRAAHIDNLKDPDASKLGQGGFHV